MPKLNATQARLCLARPLVGRDSSGWGALTAMWEVRLMTNFCGAGLSCLDTSEALLEISSCELTLG